MSVHLSASTAAPIPDADQSISQSGSSDEEEDNDESWDDFAEDSIAHQPCLSLFEDRTFPSVTEALENDRSKHDFDINQTCSRIGEDRPI